MSGVHRFLSKRDKHRDSGKHNASSNTESTDATTGLDPDSPQDFYGLLFNASKPSSLEETKIKGIRQKVVAAKSVLLKDGQILWALRCNYSNGNANLAEELLIALSNASEGIIIPFSPRVRLLGAVNRHNVTCFLDSTLFAMFSRLDSFEAMLYNSFEDRPRNRLSFLLRVWVNLLRSGKLINSDITQQIQDSLAECGWEEAAKLHQQDASEAFTFITEVLKLPLLTLKMDMFHAGKQDADDHRFINERLLEVAIPANDNGEHKDIKLEDCLEEYFNNRIEVRRYLERRSTMGSTRSFDSISKQGAMHVETLEIDADNSPLSPISPVPSYVASPRPSFRTRTPSIIQERYMPEKSDVSVVTTNTSTNTVNRLRKGSMRKEVLMPAWQFFSLIPWYTDNTPSSDAQVAAHFSSKRPVLGLCLKRYSILPNGKAIRLNTYVDIPVEIGLPHFIQDDRMDEEGPVFGNFKLSLQSVVCHRGNSVDSGHYISLARGIGLAGSELEKDQWMRFDDLASERVTTIDIHQALRVETPYLLFYQIMPVDGDPGNLTFGEAPPPYEISQRDADDRSKSQERRLSMIPSEPPSGRPSLDLPSPDEFRGRGREEGRRPSAVSFGELLPTRSRTEGDLSEANQQKSSSQSRTSTVVGKTLSNLAGGRSKDTSPIPNHGEMDIMVKISEAPTLESVPSAEHTRVPEPAPELVKKEKDKDKGKGKRIKSRSRYRSEHPDRECMVM